MQLTRIKKITGLLVLKTGLHIGGGDTEMRIGGIDSPVIKDPVSELPYIPGSSIKGKMRSLLEWRLGLVLSADGRPFSFQHLTGQSDTPAARDLLKLFGGAPGGDIDQIVSEIGPTRLSFWDCPLNAEWKKSALDERNLPETETKTENSIDRIRGVAANGAIRQTERVVAGAEFDFSLTLKVHDNEELLEMVLTGLKLLEHDSLGGSGSRGYGKIVFRNLSVDGMPLQEKFDQIQPFRTAA